MNADVLTTKVTEGIAVITLGSAKRMYFDAEMGDALTERLQEFAGDPNIRVVIVTGGTPGYFNRHFSIPALIEFAEAVRASGRQWPDNAAYHGGFFDKAMALCETYAEACHRRDFRDRSSRGLRVHACVRHSHRRGRRLSDRSARDRTRPAAWRQRHTKTATHDRTGGGPHAHPYGAAAQSARGRKEGPCSRNRKRQGHRSRDGDRKAVLLAHAGIARLYQASRPECDRHASRRRTGSRTKSLHEIVRLRPGARAHALI